MMEPWNFKTDDSREANSRTTFIIFCEDGTIEPVYFETFRNNAKIQISAIPNCGQHHKQVDYATEYCRKNDLLETIAEKEVLKIDEGAQVWCVFDRDKEDGDGKDSSFNNSINCAANIGIKAAWSNDDFELWILLHFEDVDVTDVSYNNRKKYYERLTEILKKIEPKNEEEKQITGHSKFDYYTGMKNKKNFIRITHPHMKDKIDIATQRAKALEIFHSDPKKPYHSKCPCTMVHHLVEELIRFGT